MLTYTVEVYTGSEPGAETDGPVFLHMHGSRGDSGRRVLYHSQAHDKKFRNGQCDVFEIEAVSLDDIQQIDIGHENKGKGEHAMVGCLGFFHVQLCSRTVTIISDIWKSAYCNKGDMILPQIP